MTGIVFQHGAELLGSAVETCAAMFRLGAAFGELVYLLDAFEDDSKDARRGDFNALQTAYGQSGSALSVEHRDLAIQLILGHAAIVNDAIQDLNLSSRTTEMYVQRLNANTAEKLGIAYETSCSARGCSTTSNKERISRWKRATDTATRLTAQHRAECAGVLGTVKAPVLFGIVLVIALLFPRQAVSAASYRECIGLLFNLMVWGAAFNAVLAMPRKLAPSLQFEAGPQVRMLEPGVTHSHSQDGGHTTVVTTTTVRRRRPGCCGGCDCDCCCDGCCDACNCACCTCEACECASCACDSCAGC